MAAISAFWLFMAFTCEVPEIEVEDREFLLTKEWKIKEIIRGGGLGDPIETDISSWRLDLRDDFSFSKIGFSNADQSADEMTGTWNLLANQTELQLISTDTVELKYALISLKLREIQMSLIYDSSADILPKVPCSTNLCTTYILEPVKQ